MARCPLVRPDSVRVELSQGDWLELKRELTSGEYRQMFVAQVKDTALGDKPTIDLQNVGVSKVLAYVVGWSFVDWNGNALQITRDVLDKFDASTFNEITAAVDAHHEAWEKALDERKNVQAGGNTSTVISSSAA